MNKSEFLELNLPSRDNTDDIADVNAISNNFQKIDNAFLDIVEKELPKYQTKDNLINAITDNSSDDNLYPSVPAVSKYTNEKVEPLKIVNFASGNAISLKDSAKDKLKGLKLYGKTTQNGTPTPDSPVPLVSVGDSGSFEVGVYSKNVLVNTATTTTANGVTCTVNADKSITISGTNMLSHSYRFTVGSFELPKGDYILTGNNSNGQNDFMLLQRGNGTLTQQWNGKEVAFSVTETETITVYYVVNANATVSNTIYPMIRLATVTDNTYEPCNKQNLTFTDTLRGIGDTADEKDFAKGVTTQRFTEIDLGTLTYQYQGDNNLTRFIASISLSGHQTSRTTKGLCDSFIVLSNGETYDENWNGVVYIVGGEIFIHDKRYTDASALKTALSGVKLVYELATPIETPLTETELNAYRQLYTNKGNTTILSEADMEVSYVADTKLYIDNKIAELTALTLEV